MAIDSIDRGDGVKEIEGCDWLILWDGTPDGWLRSLVVCDLEWWR
ncbi:hypothetical protein [Haloterrigena salifodinae]|nr:hypothetical protein [Haloterrigena salifodinae]